MQTSIKKPVCPFFIEKITIDELKYFLGGFQRQVIPTPLSAFLFIISGQGAHRLLQTERGRLQPAAAEPALRGAAPAQGGLALHQLPLS